jgi:hypothetical protein
VAQGMFIPDMVEEDHGGIAAKHPNRFSLPLLIAPTHKEKADAFNTLRHSLVTVACKDVPDAHFEFDSSFVGPASADAFKALSRTVFRHPDCPLAIWGHADPEGELDYNKWLSERRAEAVYAVLIRDTDTWERLFSSKPARGQAIGDVWGDKAIRIMLETVGIPYDETAKDPLADAVKRYRESLGETNASGKHDAPLRKMLFLQYMQAICRTEHDLPYALAKKDFLGEGGDFGPFQGCSEFNPQIILAKAESDHYKKQGAKGKEPRHAANRDTRRVMIFLFAPGTKLDPDPKKWPCPRAKEGIQRCLDHRWSDHKDRLNKQYPLRRRRFGKQVRNETDRMSRPEMTFGCRFYHGLAQRSPCERDLQMYAIQLLVDAPTDAKNKDDPNRFRPAANVRFVVVLGESAQAAVVRGRTTENGMIGIPYLSPLSSAKLKLDIAGIALGGISMDDPPPAPGADGGSAVPAASNGKAESGNGTGNSSGNGAAAGASAPAAEGDRKTSTHADTDRFDDEDTFIVYDLRPDGLFRIKARAEPELQPPPDPAEPPPEWKEPDADVPPVSAEERDTGARQRLFNLGYGNGLSETWTDAQLAGFVKKFQKDQKLPETGALDPDTINRLHAEHGG